MALYTQQECVWVVYSRVAAGYYSSLSPGGFKNRGACCYPTKSLDHPKDRFAALVPLSIIRTYLGGRFLDTHHVLYIKRCTFNLDCYHHYAYFRKNYYHPLCLCLV